MSEANHELNTESDVWKCPRCGGEVWRVAGTYVRKGMRRRQRACRNCKYSMQTFEVPVPRGFTAIVVKDGSGSKSLSEREPPEVLRLRRLPRKC